MEFYKPVYMLRNKQTNKILTPIKSLSGCWFRAVYDTESSAQKAVKRLNQELKESPRGYKDILGEYEVVEVKEVKL